MAHGPSPAVSSSSPVPTDTVERSPGAGPGSTPIHWAPKYGAYPVFDQESRSSPHSFFARPPSSLSTSLAMTASEFVAELRIQNVPHDRQLFRHSRMLLQISWRNQPFISASCAWVIRGRTGGTGAAISGWLTTANRWRRDGGWTANLSTSEGSIAGGDALEDKVCSVSAPEGPAIGGESVKCVPDGSGSNGDDGTSCLMGAEGDDGSE